MRRAGRLGDVGSDSFADGIVGARDAADHVDKGEQPCMMSDDEGVVSLWLHARLLIGDPLAKEEACDRYLAPITRWLVGKYRTTDREVIHDAVVDALLDYVEQPDRFDPTRRSLVGFLRMAAERDLQNARPRHVRRLEQESGGDPVELEAVGRNIEAIRGRDVGDEVADEDAAGRLLAEVMALMEDNDERTVLRLQIGGARDTATFAEALGWGTLSAAEQRTRVNRLKDRVTKRLRRRLPRTNDG